MITLTLNPLPANSNCGDHNATDWEVATDSNFTNIIHQSLNDTNNLLTIDFPEDDFSQLLYARAKYITSICNLDWTDTTIEPVIPAVTIETPKVYLENLDTLTKIRTDPFISNPSGEIHTSTIWEIKDEYNNLLLSTEVTTGNLLEYTLPIDLLLNDTQYCYFAKHISNQHSSSFGATVGKYYSNELT